MSDALAQAFLVIGGAFAAVACLVRLRLSPIVGYLAAGLLLGPTGLGLLSPNARGTHFLGDLGIALLMFVIGLEFSLPRLLATGRSILGPGLATFAAMATIVGLIAHLIGGLSVTLAVLVGGAVAMSSTAIVHKQLIDADETASRHGLAASGILLVEDLAALALLAVVSSLHARHGNPDLKLVVARLAISAVSFAGTALLARRTLGRLLEWVARSNVNELFLLAVLTLIIGAALAAQSVGLSLPLGAFVVGMIVGESDFRHQLEEEIRPFRDLLVGIFFITVGMSVDWAEIGDSLGVTVAILLVIVTIKLGVVFTVSRLAGLGFGSGLRTGLLLAHSGEFGLLVVERCMDGALLPPHIGQPILGAIAISMLTGPILAQFGDRIVSAFRLAPDLGDPHEPARHADAEPLGLSDHVVLAGCGPVGRLVALTLEADAIPYLAIERDVERLRRAQRDGHRAVFGDATRAGILEAAGIDRAKALVVLVNDWRRSTKIIREAKRLNPAIHIIASLRDDVHLGEISEAGASHIFPENYAAGLGLAAQALMSLGVAPAEAMEKIQAIRAELSPQLRLLPA